MSLSKREQKALRACLGCSFVQRIAEFYDRGCPNCDEALQMQGSADTVQTCTTSAFDGLIAMTKPEQSWVAKWQRIDKRVPGLYAVKMTGRLPEEQRQALGMRD